MEIDITDFFNNECPMDYSASVAEIGANAGQDTWNAALERAEEEPKLLDTPEKIDAMRQFARSSGGWTDEEVAAWSEKEVNALFIQWISGDIREGFEWNVEDKWAHYEQLCVDGQVSSNIYRSDGGRVYFYLGD